MRGRWWGSGSQLWVLTTTIHSRAMVPTRKADLTLHSASGTSQEPVYSVWSQDPINSVTLRAMGPCRSPMQTWPKAGVGTRCSERKDCTRGRGQSSAWDTEPTRCEFLLTEGEVR